ncbi:MAG: PAQR family membrane homeostasis protein TrhA [Fusobacteriaceae bacterium]
MSLDRMEEWTNSLTHYLGVVLGLIGMGALLVKGSDSGNTGYLVGSIIFTLSIILLYSMSGTYHILNNGKAKYIFRILDHSAIFILISGSYTPYFLGVFHGEARWIFLGLQWGLTFLGIIFKIFFVGKFEFLSTAIYLIMGWMVVFVFPELKSSIPIKSLNFLILGGVSYSVGVIFYALKIRFMHAVWHLFVLAGSIFIYFSVFYIY